MVRLRAVPAVVLICGNDLHFWRFGQIIPNGLYGVIVDEMSGANLIPNGTVRRPLLVQRERVP